MFLGVREHRIITNLLARPSSHQRRLLSYNTSPRQVSTRKKEKTLTPGIHKQRPNGLELARLAGGDDLVYGGGDGVGVGLVGAAQHAGFCPRIAQQTRRGAAQRGA